jgi:D-alanyl-D-alanine carboxypeptidase
VPIEELRIVSISFWGFDDALHIGQLIVNRTITDDVVKVFGALFRARFPIERMVPVDVYEGNDERSMEADNTSAFNCRPVTGGTSFSEHSYGWAIDINPLRNPYVTSTGDVLPPAGARYTDRSLHLPGMIHAGDLVVRAFASVGWTWGGSWSSIKDYQHFSATGR